jgi:hypothetical protein
MNTRAGRSVGHGVGNTTEDSSHARHPLVAHHDQVSVLAFGNPQIELCGCGARVDPCGSPAR